MGLYFVKQDIVQMETDAIVNAANEGLWMGGGVCGAIFAAAGPEELQAECRQKAPCPTGRAMITGGYHLKAKHVIYAVGPRWQGGKCGERELLAGAYRNSLELAKAHGCRSVAFPLISAGIFGYPREEALRVAVEAIRAFLEETGGAEPEMEVYLTLFGPLPMKVPEKLAARVELCPEQGGDLRTPLSRNAEELTSVLPDEAWIPEAPAEKAAWIPEAPAEEAACIREALPRAAGRAPAVGNRKLEVSQSKKRRLEELLAHMDETFSQMLLRMIDEKQYTDVEVYKRANLDRKLFSKIRSNPDYVPKKQTVLAFAVALRLSEDETEDLLRKAGYSLSGSSRMDVIVHYYIKEKEYDMDLINETLFFYGQPMLGSR